MDGVLHPVRGADRDPVTPPHPDWSSNVADLTPGSGRRLTRKEREKRVTTLLLGSGGAGIAAVVFGVLAILDIVGFGVVILLVLLAVALAYGASRAVKP